MSVYITRIGFLSKYVYTIRLSLTRVSVPVGAACLCVCRVAFDTRRLVYGTLTDRSSVRWCAARRACARFGAGYSEYQLEGDEGSAHRCAHLFFIDMYVHTHTYARFFEESEIGSAHRCASSTPCAFYLCSVRALASARQTVSWRVWWARAYPPPCASVCPSTPIYGGERRNGGSSTCGKRVREKGAGKGWRYSCQHHDADVCAR
jgi:hypothetical protein